MMMMPNIIRESSEGLARIPLTDALYQKREIYCIGEITKESAHALVMQLRWLQMDSPGAEIMMYIDSPGGEVSSGLAVYDVMQAIQCPIRTVCANAASILLRRPPLRAGTQLQRGGELIDHLRPGPCV